MEILLGSKCFTFDVLEGRTTDEDLEKCDTKRPNIRLAGVVECAAGAFRGEILRDKGVSTYREHRENEEGRTSGVP